MTAEVITVNPCIYVLLAKLDEVKFEVVDLPKTEQRVPPMDKEKS